MAVKRQETLDRLAKVGPRAAAAAASRLELQETTPPGMLTVAQAAERLGATKAQVRDALSRPELAGRFVPRRTAADGQKPSRSVLIFEEFVDQVAKFIERPDSDTAAHASAEVASVADDAASPAASAPEAQPQHSAPQPQAEMSLAIVYERLLAEKDLRIDDLRAEIANLRSVLEREQAGHARAQALLALQAPISSVIEAVDDDADGYDGGSGNGNTSGDDAAEKAKTMNQNETAQRADAEQVADIAEDDDWSRPNPDAAAEAVPAPVEKTLEMPLTSPMNQPTETPIIATQTPPATLAPPPANITEATVTERKKSLWQWLIGRG